MPRALVPLAEGFEEMEAIVVIDVLRRAGVEVVSASLQPGAVRASRQTQHLADSTLADVQNQDFDLIVLPGGGEGARRLQEDVTLASMLKRHQQMQKRIAAICAAPTVLRVHGILSKNDPFTLYPGHEAKASGGSYHPEKRVVRAGLVTTSQGPGTSFEFALDLVEQLCGAAKRQEVSAAMLVQG
ncbi:MAG: DJ-1/PfpI family protein [Leptospirales bacterium]|nr:DJ-1/PfpI family protein [Leptospirales bacterium]